MKKITIEINEEVEIELIKDGLVLFHGEMKPVEIIRYPPETVRYDSRTEIVLRQQFNTIKENLANSIRYVD
ncbi:hypothetical protein CL621_00030 [archaeon]|jgi:hypothetical protein|nr:hypothetical protein [archaeon]|tara:strand:+ start:1131 stop:1343 length:213 start_codon:yes stop_codon:yes gene_type:complete